MAKTNHEPPEDGILSITELMALGRLTTKQVQHLSRTCDCPGCRRLASDASNAMRKLYALMQPHLGDIEIEIVIVNSPQQDEPTPSKNGVH